MEAFVSTEEQELFELLNGSELNQSHLFSDWDDVGVNEELKHDMMAQLLKLNNEYAINGGLKGYINNAKQLLQNSKIGVNPFQDWVPDMSLNETESKVQFHSKLIEPLSDAFMELEAEGLKSIGNVAFILVAGGLGERLGYQDIKISLPVETITNESYISHYCSQILAIQHRYTNNSLGEGVDNAHVSQDGYLHIKHTKQMCLPLVIMVSDDTHDQTINLLVENNYFGLLSDQVSIIKQGKVPALSNNDALISKSSTYVINAKPHGHGDIHSLLYSSGLPQSWLKRHSHIEYCLFFQDTNALGFNTVPIMIGNSRKYHLDMNSMAVPRAAKQAVGALVHLKHKDGLRMTVNVEYNLLDPLLRATVSPEGDLNDETTHQSPFPGNINMLLMKLSSYVEVLEKTRGVLNEFVNPKYVDDTKTVFKKPTRIECMMQDIAMEYAKGSTYRVGYTLAPAWFSYNPCKNNATDAIAMVEKGIPAAAPIVAESAQYSAYAALLSRHGVQIASNMNESLTMHTFLGLTAALGPRIIISPHIAIFASEIIKLFPFPSSVSISSESTLICRHKQKVESNAEADSRSFFGGHPCKWVERKCPLIIQQLDLDGTLDIEVDLHSNVANQLIIGEEISPCTSKSQSKHVSIHNRGHCLVSTVESTPDSPLSVEVIAMRGYIFKLVESTKVVIPPTDAHTNTTDASVDANLSDESIPIAIDTCSGSARQNIYRWDGDHVVLQEHY